MPAFKILVAEADEPFRRFIRTTLQDRPEFEIAAEAEDGLDAVWQATRLQPHLVLLDVALPRVSGLEAAKRIRNLAPLAKIVFVSRESSLNDIQECFRLGARGYVQKASAESDLLPAIDAVLRGIRFVSKGLDFLDSSDDIAPASTES